MEDETDEIGCLKGRKRKGKRVVSDPAEEDYDINKGLHGINSIDTGSSEPSFQAKDGGRPKRPNITVKFPPPFIKCD
ncbi:hypothetical protein AVEN_219211-1 [Araneus ventricosus]|uniref:Uncharacterized protein n=1 Tax=Araneus ventricosus TaxID=182803 RepID=A0A4Y2UMV2_ARAVE|nr:hypothetical protein AVEN_219211-1 [Araneus ventricosus]